MRKAATVVAVFALPLILAAFAVECTLSGSGTAGPETEPPSQEPVASTTPVEVAVPKEDVPGKDLTELPRYQGSTRVAYRHEKLDGLARTRAEYATDADPDEVRAFYRGAFDSGGWTVADLGFSPEKWHFFVVKDEREALVRIYALRRPVAVEIELTGLRRGAPAGDDPQPVRPAPAPTSNMDDDDDGGEYDDYEGGED